MARKGAFLPLEHPSKRHGAQLSKKGPFPDLCNNEVTPREWAWNSHLLRARVCAGPKMPPAMARDVPANADAHWLRKRLCGGLTPPMAVTRGAGKEKG